MADNNNELPRSYEFDGYRLIPDRRRLLGPDGEPLALRGKVFDLLLHLIENRGHVVEKSALMQALWPNIVVDENNLNQAMTALRHALGETAQAPKFVATITGRGYQFVGDVRVISGTQERARNKSLSKTPYAFGAIAAIVAAGLLVWLGRSDPPPRSAVLEQFDQLSPRLVTDFHGSHSQPTLSPDGTMMAWVSDIDGTSQVWVGNLQSGNPIQITWGDFKAASPSWSPDNSQIVYERSGSGRVEIYSVGTLGTPPPRILIDSGASPSFALRVNQFVFERGQQIWIASGDGSNARKIENLPVDQGFADRLPALSPDGSLIAFLHADAGPFGNLWVIGSEPGAKPRQLTTYGIKQLKYVSSHAFTPDGETIVFSLGEENGTSSLWEIPVDGGDAEALSSGSGTFNFPVVSANGKRMVYTDRRLTSKLVVVSLDTGERKSIYESRHNIVLPMASPGGSQIVFFSPLSNGAHIMTISADGGSLRQRTFNEGGVNALPLFGSNEESVYYYDNSTFVRQYTDEGRVEIVFEDFHWSTRNWPAVFEDRIAYQEIDRTTNMQRTVIHDLSDGSEVELPVKLEALSWSRDGRELLGFVRNPGDITICVVDSLTCEAISSLGAPVRGYLPRWSRDEQRIYYLRQSEAGDCCDLWAVGRDGSNAALLTHLGGFDRMNSYYGITDTGNVFYNFNDSSSDEIWLLAAD